MSFQFLVSHHGLLDNTQTSLIIAFNVCWYVCTGMKWGWRRALCSAVPPATGPLHSPWTLLLQDNQRHCWTFSPTRTPAYRPPFCSPGPLQLSQMAESSITKCTADWALPRIDVMLRHWFTGISLLLVKMNPCSRLLCTSTRYDALCF